MLDPEARARGGRETARRRKLAQRVRVVTADELPGALETLEDAARWAAWIPGAVATGRIDPKTAHEMIAGVKEKRLAEKDKRDTDRRIRELERQLAQALDRMKKP